MVSSTACSKNVIERLRCWLLVLALLLPVLGWTAEIDISAPQITAGEDGYVLSADFNFELNQRLEETVTRGVVLYFVADFELSRPRWYWLDEKMASHSQTYRLSYHALTRQYRLSTGALHQSFSTLTEALRMLAHLRNWVVVDKNDKSVRPGEPYLAALRLRLDITQLPRPFQLTALGNKEWSLASDWKTWPVSLSPALPVEAK
jgi:hypothetical protein